jgi:prepilin-type N-terminal cleavage/methylation domain-containing protein
MNRNATRRSAFTLIELLVVIAIIAVLASLLSAALFRARAVSEDLDCRNDIVNLHNAIATFCQDQRIGALGYMPSKFDPSGGDQASKTYIMRMFPRIASPSLGAPAQLEGHQCLVFFLQGPSGNGFSTNPLNPLDTQGDRIGPYYTFKQERLKSIGGGQYQSYLDRWKKQPIAYFSATQFSPSGYIPNAFGTSDNASIGVQPYFNPAAPQQSPNITTWQLISAGRDMKFGTKGGTWNPLSAQQIYPKGDPGFDDITNFSNSLLGARQ